MIKNIPLISCQRYLDPEKVIHKACCFRVFVVHVLEVELRGVMYRFLTDGHHNLAAAKLIGVEPTWRGPSKKLQRVMKSMGSENFAKMLINNLTDSDWYYIESGNIVNELLGIESSKNEIKPARSLQCLHESIQAAGTAHT